jgi:hypothetical protein
MYKKLFINILDKSKAFFDDSPKIINGIFVLSVKTLTFVFKLFKPNKMVEIKKNISKEIFIQQIVSEINEIPLIYLQTLYSLVHTFKENILAIPPQPTPAIVPTEEVFDWDNLLNDIYLNRQKNNQALRWLMI